MPHLTLQVSSAGGPLIDLLVGVSGPREAALIKAGQPVPIPVPARFLIDTGASVTAIDPHIMKRLALTPTGAIPIYTPSTGSEAQTINQFDVGLIIPTRHMTRHFSALPVCECELRNQSIDGLIGRVVLDECLLVYDGPASTFILSI